MHIVLISATKFGPLEKSGWNKGLASTSNLCYTPLSPVLLPFFLFYIVYLHVTCVMSVWEENTQKNIWTY
jgi:hypothetical protein